jgi:gliding motility-associated-like protein
MQLNSLQISRQQQLRLFGCLLWLSLLFQGSKIAAQSQERVYVLNGRAFQYSQTPECFQLTEAQNGQVGSVWYQNKLVLTENFDFEFELYFGTKDQNGADGIGFVLQPISTGEGSQGEGMGFQGIRPSVVVEYDTWQNIPFDPAYDHIAILRDGDHRHNGNTLAGPVQASATNPNIEDGRFHSTRLVWNAFTLTLTVYFDGVLRASYSGDLVNTVFGGNPNVFWGFTSATGGANNVHRVCITSTEFKEQLTAQVTLKHVTCRGNGDGEIQIKGFGGKPPYRYSTDGGRTFLDQTSFSGLAPGTYLVQIKDANNELSPLQILILREAQVPLSASSTQIATGCFSSKEGALRAQGQGGEAPYRYSIRPAGEAESAYQEEDTFRGLAAGRYTVNVTDAFGCTVSVEQQIEELPLPAPELILGSQSVCPGVAGVTYSIPDPSSPTGYRWFIRGGTIVAGQGSASVTVNWGPANTSASLLAIGTNEAGCPTDTARLPVRVNPLLLTPTPDGSTLLCTAGAQGIRYETSFTPGSTYTWHVTGGTIVSPEPNAHAVMVDWLPGTGQGKIVVTQNSLTDLARCFGQSDTLYVNFLPSPDPMLTIEGPDASCENSQNLSYRLNGLSGSTYRWTLNGTTLSATGSSVTISLGPAGPYTLTATETTPDGCQGPAIQKQIMVHPLPSASSIAGPAAVCPENLNGIVYRLDGLPGSSFAWTVTGGTLRSGQGTNQVTVDFDTSTNKTISGQETSANGCVGPLVTARVLYDDASLQLLVATTDEQDEQQIVLHLAMPRSEASSNPIKVFRREAGNDWTMVGETSTNSSSYTDASANPASRPYFYRVQSANACATPLTSNAHRTIWLQATGNEQQETVHLRWTHYRGWEQGVKEYQVLRKLDGETAFSHFRTVPASDTTFSAVAARDGFRQTYRLKAIPAGSGSPILVSWSNSDVVSFENPLVFYNIFTPNGDGRNDTFYIDNIHLYPGNELAVFTRWGKEVFRKRDYDNSWDGKELAEGIYYYQLTLPDQSSRKGWVELVR